MGKQMLPQSDGASLAWMRHFVGLLCRRAAFLGVLQQDAEEARRAVAAYEEVYGRVLARDPEARLNLALKQERRQAAERRCGQLAAQVMANPRVDEQDRIDLGLVNGGRRGRRSVPQVAPVLELKWADGDHYDLAFFSPDQPMRRGRPTGVVSVEIARVVGDGEVFDPSRAQVVHQAVRSPVRLSHPGPFAGRIATHFARFKGKRGDAGPWSAPLFVLLKHRLAA